MGDLETQNAELQPLAEDHPELEENVNGNRPPGENNQISILERIHAVYVAVITDWPWEIGKYVASIGKWETPKWAKYLRWIYIFIRILLAFVGLIAQAIICFRRDRLDNDFTNTRTDNDSNRLVECHEPSQLFSAIIIPDVIFLLLIFWVSRYTLFCKDENKDLSELVKEIEKIDRQAGKCIKYFYTLLPLGYLIFSQAVSIMDLFAFNIKDSDVVIHWSSDSSISGSLKIFIIAISFLGFIAFDLLYIQLIVRYSLQCQLNIYFLQEIKKNIKETKGVGHYKSQTEAIEDVEKARNFINQLNTSSITLGVGIMITAVQAINCIINFLDKGNTIFQAIALLLRLSHWLFLTLFPLFQAALVNFVSLKLCATGLVMRRMPVIFQGNNEHQNNILNTYASLITIKAKLFGFTVHTWFPYVIMILIALTLTVGSRFKWYENIL